jgi:hypothetical protein
MKINVFLLSKLAIFFWGSVILAHDLRPAHGSNPSAGTLGEFVPSDFRSISLGSRASSSRCGSDSGSESDAPAGAGSGLVRAQRSDDHLDQLVGPVNPNLVRSGSALMDQTVVVTFADESSLSREIAGMLGVRRLPSSNRGEVAAILKLAQALDQDRIDRSEKDRIAQIASEAKDRRDCCINCLNGFGVVAGVAISIASLVLNQQTKTKQD